MDIRYALSSLLPRLCVCLCLLLLGSAAAQDRPDKDDPMHNLLTQTRVSQCQEYVYNAQRLIPRYHQLEHLDSVDMVIAYVEKHCGSQQFESYLVLRDILTGDLPPDWCDSVLARSIVQRPGWQCFAGIWGFPFGLPSGTDTSYSQFIASLAGEAAAISDSTSFAHATAVFFGGDQPRVIRGLKRGQYGGTCLQDAYDRQVDSLVKRRNDFVTNWSVNAGVWIPDGPVEVLGTKPELGGQAGLRKGRFGADVSLLFRFVDTDKPWFASHNGRLYETTYFHSIYFGVEPNFTVYSTLGSRLELFAGAGWDGVLGLTADVIDEEYGDYLNSYNINFGFTQRFFFGTRRTWYVGVQARYNIVDYDTDGGTDLSGNTISLNLLWGSMGHPGVDDELEWLGYYGK